MPPVDTLVFTDLDGTLLDHETYGFDPARPALRQLHDLGIPVILTTSKTLVEVIDLNRALHNPAPAIVENGGAIAFPLDRSYPFELPAYELIQEQAVIRFSPDYSTIRDFIEHQRAEHGYRLRGFGDMRAIEVAQLTGLATEEAEQARERLCSEPFVWDDNEARLRDFAEAAASAGLRLTRGGRFHHLMGDTSKAVAMRAMRDLYATDNTPKVVACGDSDNDIEMLESADVAIVVMRPDGTHLSCKGRANTIKTVEPGPAGWNMAIETLLGELGPQSTG
jgi:mannosyl-3-phosphoglycerate phosphatase